MKLVYESSGVEVKEGDEANLKDGKPVIVTSIEKPRHGGSTGRVHVRVAGTARNTGYYPSVIGAKWIDRDDQF